MLRHFLTKMRAGQVLVDNPFVIGTRGIGAQTGHIGRIGRKPSQRQRDPSHARRRIGDRIPLQAVLIDGEIQLSVDIDFSVGFLQGFERPMLLVVRSLRDPLLQNLLFLVGQLAIGGRRRHDRIRIGGNNPLPSEALAQASRLDRSRLPFAARVGIRSGIKPQSCLTRFGIKAVAAKACLRKDRTDIPIEFNRILSSNRGARDGNNTEKGGKKEVPKKGLG